MIYILIGVGLGVWLGQEYKLPNIQKYFVSHCTKSPPPPEEEQQQVEPMTGTMPTNIKTHVPTL